MAALYVKDLNWINYGVLTCGYFYFSKKVDSFLINGNSPSKTVGKGNDKPQLDELSLTNFIRRTIVFEDNIKLEKSHSEGTI